MILGVLSDSHGRAARTARAIGLLKSLGAQEFVYCGDAQTEGVLDELALVRARFVWGNVDMADAQSNAYAQSVGLDPPCEVPVRFAAGGRQVAVFHGHEPQFQIVLEALHTRGDGGLEALQPKPDIILHGHTHVARSTRVGSVRIVNPGALHRASPHSVATIDLDSERVSFWIVDERSDSDVPREFLPK